MVSSHATQPRRLLRFECWDELIAEVERIATAARQGRVRTLGRWSVGQIFQHLARTIEASYGQRRVEAAWPVRLLGRVMMRLSRGRLLDRPFRPGWRAPRAGLPDADVSLDEAVAELRAWLERVQRGEPMVAASPFLGQLSQDQWMRLHQRHAELHLGFILVDPGDV